jgi:RimJ/RimL family protein N-acetyltransferase
MPFDLQPTLRGRLVELRPMRPDDFPALFAVAADPLIWEQHPARDRYQRAVFQQYFQEGLDCGGAFVILDAQDGAIIGSSRYYGFDESRSEIEIGWTFLARRCWGGAYNRELKTLMLQHAFRFVTTVLFFVGPHNLRSQRAMEKIGGIRAGTRIVRGAEQVVFEIRRPGSCA